MFQSRLYTVNFSFSSQDLSYTYPGKENFTCTMIQPKMKSNTAAYQPAVGEKLHIKEASYPSPSKNQIVVQNRAIGINPVDWKVQDVQLFPTFKYPTVLGSDVAGIVAEIGSGVTRFKRGDAVVGHAVGMMSQTPAASAFQEYTVLQENLVARLPSFLTYERAAVLPTGVSTAACGLFQKDHLALELPSANPKSTGKTLLVWGGSSNVGTNRYACPVLPLQGAPKHKEEWSITSGFFALRQFSYRLP